MITEDLKYFISLCVAITLLCIFFIFLPLNSISGGVENICYNYPPSSEYYLSYPQELKQEKVVAKVNNKTVKTQEIVTSLYPVYLTSELEDYLLNISFVYKNKNYLISKIVDRNIYNSIKDGDEISLRITTTNCFETDKSIIKYSDQTIYFDLL